MRKYAAGILALALCFCIPSYAEHPMIKQFTVSAEENRTVVYDGLIYSVGNDWATLEGCTDKSVTSVNIPAEIEGKCVGFVLTAFRDCRNLEYIEVDKENAELCSMDGVLFTKSGGTLLEYPIAKAGAYTIPPETTQIGGSAFKNCAGLTSVTLHENVELYGGSCFQNCENLTEVNGVIRMQQGHEFVGCEKITSLTIGNCSVSQLVLKSMGSLTSVNILADCCFDELVVSKCPQLKTLIINGTACCINRTDAAVRIAHCPELTELQLPVNVKMVGGVPGGFVGMTVEISECDALEEITCRYPGRLSVTNCTSLKQINYHEESGYDHAYEGCDALEIICGRNADEQLRKFCEQKGITYIAFEDVLPVGDVNADGTVDILDVIQLNRAILGGETLSSLSETLSDFDGDGRIAAADSLLILKQIIGII